MVNPRKKPRATRPARRRKAPSQTESTSAKSKVPAAVANAQIKRVGGFFADAINMIWDRPDSEDPILQYQIQQQVKTPQGGIGEWGEIRNPHTGTLTQWKVEYVPKADQFNFRIRAKNEHGWGAWSKSFPES